MNRMVLGWVVTIAAAVAMADDAQIRRQFSEYYVQTSASESAVKKYMQSMRTDGTWADIDYESKRRGSWPTRGHLTRLEGMAVVYADPEAKLFQSLELRDAIVTGLNHWLEMDYRNPNWWQGRIGVPKSMAATLILLGDGLPDDVLKRARPILLRSKMGMTGQNKVWCAGNNVMIGLLYDEPERIEKAVAEIWSELRVSTEEGIQPDWSFHQHGPQQQFGNYGASFAGDMIKWASILRGTDYALSGDKLEILRNYMLNGVSWIIWNGRMDLSGCGRQIDRGAQAAKGRGTLRQLKAMPSIDPECSGEYKAVLNRAGFNPFWRSEMAVQRRPDWYASVRMSSTRVIGAETCNSENMQGLHLGDGMLLVYRDGSEYEDIVPLWDWKRLPGTTCDQGQTNLVPKSWNKGYGGSDFSGVLGTGETGMAAMMYKRKNLVARKSYFFFRDQIVCLGAGISGETDGDVYTSIEQSWMKGDVQKDEGFIHHNGIAYQVLDGDPVLRSGNVVGNWTGSFPDRADRPESGDVFSAWINHGKSPKDATYAYRIFSPAGNERSGQMSEVLSNTKALQAVTCEQTVYAVFYVAGRLEIGAGRAVEASGPCLLLMGDKGLKVADPTHSLQTLKIRVNEKSYQINLPQGADRGKQVAIRL
ncbi:polysaccharide lyase family 8 super-sandwich domain-containing protein [Pontiella agarivorans]|uniref:Polysaccharide lyase family 8 super-sandwich domain-containing protein n=1 Tax=Pontiella agarivorans TaxID=3038953 RepID=A0ABU5MY89_9BACT|nr:polysaccharide lyase family 8 super-sandwich domain-containing protein [Pontiella agarivorans]MDZ8119167.1 polysaccharide lyase family 8 super-sandwich domain-containing protein [Pontiella agarivorans]